MLPIISISKIILILEKAKKKLNQQMEVIKKKIELYKLLISIKFDILDTKN